MSSRLNSAGFTLVEVLVGLTLLSILMLFLFSGLRTSASSWEASDRLSRQNDDTRLITKFIRRQIKQIVPINVREGRDFEVLFHAQRDILRFVSRLPPYRGTAGLYVVSFKLRQNSDKHPSLVYTYQALHPDANPFADDDKFFKEHVLLEAVRSIEFSYFGKVDIDDDRRIWSDSWTPNDRLPELIRLNIYGVPKETDWPTIIIEIPAQVEVGQVQNTLLNPSVGPNG